ncbi:hypothetical protein CU669_08080 [Paramagnetospirillum kuznetsovii]|uniref:DUF2889 domain-containing protein n=1 Tax=Paramagnetospirillum kuznetsovii TaxID=2053833 RepID=A0A364P0H9_9PROT|nr:DUF2889 domain-containing protein [Paramagnetospirillum kuznetsovii]RAU22625.1 hypothetical protein CU669_08080 [Paramagnetospirillum kuznetsovii]
MMECYSMPLSSAGARRPIHTRTITIDGYSRDDGLWEIEGNLLDVKAYDLRGLYRHHIPAGEPIHDIRARIVVSDDMTVQSAEAVIDYSPFPMCGNIASAFADVVGLNLGTGFMKQLRHKFGGVHGCTHVCDLLGAMATTAFQTIYPVLRAERGDRSGRPELIDSCHAFASDGEVVARQWPTYSTRAKEAG